MSETPKWYVIHTYSGYENTVASSIEKAVENRGMHDLITDVTIPVEIVREVKNGKTREIERKLFPGYVLVKMILTDESWYLVRNTRGCTGFVSPNSNKPLPLTDEEAAQWGAEKHETETIEISYKVGDSVRVCDGPLSGFVGIVDEIEQQQNRVHVIVSMFGRETPVELELNQVEVVED
ncbi:MAG: transcription termination/antitermination protein NusG [Butyricicoccus sp.]|jgi:transcriptional antiterminator NusG|nr:transcription termination/antitermination protein NusG [Clostridiales bacterium]